MMWTAGALACERGFMAFVAQALLPVLLGTGLGAATKKETSTTEARRKSKKEPWEAAASKSPCFRSLFVLRFFFA